MGGRTSIRLQVNTMTSEAARISAQRWTYEQPAQVNTTTSEEEQLDVLDVTDHKRTHGLTFEHPAAGQRNVERRMPWSSYVAF